MRIKNSDIPETVAQVKLPGRPVDFHIFTVCGVPYGLDSKYSEIWPEPRIPTKTVKGAGGKTELLYLAQDERYLNETELREACFNAFMLREVLRKDKDIAFEVEPTDRDSCIALAKEISDCGLTGKEVQILLIAAQQICERDFDGDIASLFV